MSGFAFDVELYLEDAQRREASIRDAEDRQRVYVRRPASPFPPGTIYDSRGRFRFLTERPEAPQEKAET